VFDFTILEQPTIAVEPPKIQVILLLNEFISSPTTTIPFLRRLVGKLLRNAKVVLRGKLYVPGFLSLLRVAARRQTVQPE
jgi:hypothetical protein